MRKQTLCISGAYIFSHKVFPDERGVFREWFISEEIEKLDNEFSVKQANFSKSKKNVIRGIHFSIAPEGQSKVVTCVSGEMVDVLIDLRIGSSTFLKVEYLDLSGDTGKVVYIPSGVGHGFAIRSDSASVVYLTSSKYTPKYEKAICPIDPKLGINWMIQDGEMGIISTSDLNAPSLETAIKMNMLPEY